MGVLGGGPVLVEHEDDQPLQLDVLGGLEGQVGRRALAGKLEQQRVDVAVVAAGSVVGHGELLEGEVDGDLEVVVDGQALPSAHKTGLVGEAGVHQELGALEVEKAAEVPRLADGW